MKFVWNRPGTALFPLETVLIECLNKMIICQNVIDSSELCMLIVFHGKVSQQL